MILSGINNTGYTDFYRQDNFSLDIFISNADSIDINLAGSGYTGGISLYSGKITDTSGRFISSYSKNSDLDLRLAFNTGIYSLWKNGDLLICSKKLSPYVYNSGNSSITGLSIISKSIQEKDLTIGIYGEYPSLVYSNLLTEDLSLYTGSIEFPSSYGKINNIYSDRGILVSYTTGFSNTIDYILSGTNLYSGEYANLQFDTNAGLFNKSIMVDYTKPREITGSFYVSIGGIESFTYSDSGNIVNKQYNDFSLTSSWAVDTELDVYLRYNGRYGQTPVSGSGFGSGMYYGYINGSGDIYSQALTGILASYGVTGVGTGSLFTYPTGMVTYEYIASAIGFEAGHLSTGYIYGELTGVVGPGSGRYLFNQSVIGTPTISVWDGGINSSPVGLYTGSVNQEIILGKYVSLYSSGDFYGTGYVAISGSIANYNLITGEPVQFNRDIDDYWSIYNNYFNYRTNSLESGNYLKRVTPMQVSGGLYSYYGRIIYEKEGLSNVTDSVSLIVSNQYETKEFNIIGYSL